MMSFLYNACSFCLFLAPLGVFHSTAEDILFHGQMISKNTIVITNLHSVHMDPEIWPEPEHFNPERFLDKGRLKIPKAFIPFGIGMYLS